MQASFPQFGSLTFQLFLSGKDKIPSIFAKKLKVLCSSRGFAGLIILKIPNCFSIAAGKSQ
jgi:hypothetical protein